MNEWLTFSPFKLSTKLQSTATLQQETLEKHKNPNYILH